MLQFSGWFFVLLLNFLLLLWILNMILFKPLLGVFKERQNTINGSLDSARELSARKDTALDSFKKEMEAARLAAREAFEALRAEGLERQREILSRANGEAASHSEKVRKELEAEAAKARSAMRGEVEKFSEIILEKLVRT